jgi:hypothetical protein
MSLKNSNLLMTVEATDLNEYEMEAIVGGVVVPWTQMVPKIFQGAILIYAQDYSGAVNLINDTFKGVNWATEAGKQQKEFNTFYSKTKSYLQFLWAQYQDSPQLTGLNSNIKSMIIKGII